MTSDPGSGGSGGPGCEPASAGWAERDRRRVWHGFTQMATYVDNRPIVVAAADGHHLVDVDGRRYLDAISSLWVTTLGHRVPELDVALADQAGRVAHSTLLGHGSTVVVELAEALAEVVPVEDPRFLFASDGASAVEQAIKVAHQYWVNRGEPRRGYLALGGAYHGDTTGALSVGDRGFGTELFDPLRFAGVTRTPGYDRADWLPAALDVVDRHGAGLAAVVLEPVVQGASGMHVASPSDVAELVEACAGRGMLVVCDEVATGFGRTGALFASELCGITPDLLCVGKGITGGYLPMSATVAAGPVADAFLGEDLGPATLYHGHSYGGNALAAAVALRHLQLLTGGDVLANVAARSEQLRAGLAASVATLPEVAEVRLQGLMGGVELAAPPGQLRWGRRVCAAAVERGVLLRPLGDVVVVMPLLTSTASEIDEIVDVLAAAVLAGCR